jgi:hypothetical protein
MYSKTVCGSNKKLIFRFDKKVVKEVFTVQELQFNALSIEMDVTKSFVIRYVLIKVRGVDIYSIICSSLNF